MSGLRQTISLYSSLIAVTEALALSGMLNYLWALLAIIWESWHGCRNKRMRLEHEKTFVLV